MLCLRSHFKKEKAWLSAPQPFWCGCWFWWGKSCIYQLNCFTLKLSDSVGISGKHLVPYCFLSSTVFRSLWFLVALLCVAVRECVQNRWTWGVSHFAEFYAQISSLCVYALASLSWGDPVRCQFFCSFAASEILKLCLLVVCFLIGILVFLSSWLTL